jgi:hypothetical protein
MTMTTLTFVISSCASSPSVEISIGFKSCRVKISTIDLDYIFSRRDVQQYVTERRSNGYVLLFVSVQHPSTQVQQIFKFANCLRGVVQRDACEGTMRLIDVGAGTSCAGAAAPACSGSPVFPAWPGICARQARSAPTSARTCRSGPQPAPSRL